MDAEKPPRHFALLVLVVFDAMETSKDINSRKRDILLNLPEPVFSGCGAGSVSYTFAASWHGNLKPLTIHLLVACLREQIILQG
jgi:hypothetical protein